jgi:PelA/Pel-15E family pectate lyase
MMKPLKLKRFRTPFRHSDTQLKLGVNENTQGCLAGRVSRFCLCLIAFATWVVLSTSSAATIGTNVPAQALTAERISRLPTSERPPWQKYLQRSLAQRRTDQAFFEHEIKKNKLSGSTVPPEQGGVRGIALDRSAEWYASDEALHLADNIVSFQTPAGGWTKNVDMTSHPRAPGEQFAHGNLSRYPGSGDFDASLERDWNYVGTFDNDATTTQLEFLARVITARSENGTKPYQKAFLKGLDYILAAQYPNGGWPQVWPLQGGYHDAITFNDGAMGHILVLLSKIASGDRNYAFVPVSVRKHSRDSAERGIACILATQIRANGRATVWCQHHDALTLLPCSARNYEMPCQASGESAGLVLFLMDLPHPNPAVIAAIRNAVEWLEKTKVLNVEYRRGQNGPELVEAPGRGPLWARYYEIGTDRPIFGDRDKTIHDTLAEISAERQRGYRWYSDAPRDTLARYPAWKAKQKPE